MAPAHSAGQEGETFQSLVLRYSSSLANHAS